MEKGENLVNTQKIINSTSDSLPCLTSKSKKNNACWLEAHQSVKCHMQKTPTDHHKVEWIKVSKHQEAGNFKVNQTIKGLAWRKETRLRERLQMSFLTCWTLIATWDQTRKSRTRKATKIPTAKFNRSRWSHTKRSLRTTRKLLWWWLKTPWAVDYRMYKIITAWLEVVTIGSEHIPLRT